MILFSFRFIAGFPYRLLAAVFFVFFLNQCSFPIKHADALEVDDKFIFLDSRSVPIQQMRNPDMARSNLKILMALSNPDFAEKNNLAVLHAKAGQLDLAEKSFRSLLIPKPKDYTPFLNLVRMYYIIEEYSEARSFVSDWVRREGIQLEEFKRILDLFYKSYRLKERGMLLEAVEKIPGFELYAWIELSKYFLNERDLSSTEYYLQNILTLSPFDEDALMGMAELSLDMRRWQELVDYGKALNLTPNGKKKSFFYIAKGYFELGNYKEALSWIDKTPEMERANLEFLILWRDTILVSNPRASLEPIRKFFRIIQANGYEESEEAFLPTLYPKGREVMEGLIK
ncbi:tetratricopeptide repeat protein [Leptospira sp. GIMC2001]|uniref:tetratricopeptide repeat protein n=1 Tax=Leptospira sp. GIMC2001 TaxID=1513297 RepID=UPI00234B37D8|nr:hypothetical protein [Leptospira sp. GIMC2001]WCL48981.1 hypothetical protein O4O04_17050 [Leptospira sp. GIMC2001]